MRRSSSDVMGPEDDAAAARASSTLRMFAVMSQPLPYPVDAWPHRPSFRPPELLSTRGSGGWAAEATAKPPGHHHSLGGHLIQEVDSRETCRPSVLHFGGYPRL